MFNLQEIHDALFPMDLHCQLVLIQAMAGKLGDDFGNMLHKVNPLRLHDRPLGDGTRKVYTKAWLAASSRALHMTPKAFGDVVVEHSVWGGHKDGSNAEPKSLEDAEERGPDGRTLAPLRHSYRQVVSRQLAAHRMDPTCVGTASAPSGSAALQADVLKVVGLYATAKEVRSDSVLILCLILNLILNLISDCLILIEFNSILIRF